MAPSAMSVGRARLLRGFALQLPEEDIARNLGARSQGLSEVWQRAIATAREQAGKWIEPQALYRRLRVTANEGGRIVLEEGALTSAKLAGMMAGAQQLAVMVGTIGPLLEREVSRLFNEGDYAGAFVLDALGSVAVEEVLDQARSLLCCEAEQEGLAAGPALSPGYQYWDITDQRVIFDLLPTAEIGVELNSAYLMIPRKSASLAVALGRNLRIVARPGESPCRYCDRHDCYARRKDGY